MCCGVDPVCAPTYIALVVRQANVCVPDLEAVAELRETHFLHLHPKVGLQAFHHLRNIILSVLARLFLCYLLLLAHLAHLSLDFHQFLADGFYPDRAGVVGDRKEPQLLQINRCIQGQPVHVYQEEKAPHCHLISWAMLAITNARKSIYGAWMELTC